MDAAALRKWGIIVGAAVLAGAIILALPDPPRDPPPPIAPPDDPLIFLLRFAEDHPLGRAQRLARDGEWTDGQRAAERALRRGPLQGLCFERFTDTGAEIVLAPCEKPAPEELERVRAAWSARLEAMAGVDYAEANVILNTRPRPAAQD